ncbi:MAG: GNAT family N-acetyltransferase [Alphaproteobacteria bacterium]|nr:GNAT family N-acetyltransferase [Alphaproteobacteria bacterium]
MYLERFIDKQKFAEYLDVVKLADDIEKDQEPPLRLVNEIRKALDYTCSLAQNYDLNIGHWVLYALRTETGEIIGTASITEDGHFGQWAQIEYVAIRQDFQNKGFGQFMMQEIFKEIRRHSNFDCAVLTTVGGGKFYEKCGMSFAGEVNFNARLRRFYVRRLA